MQSGLTGLPSGIASIKTPGIYIGAAFDEGKLQAYSKEIQFRLALAKVFLKLYQLQSKPIFQK